MSDNGTLLKVDNLVKHFPVHAGILGQVVNHVKAVDGISFELKSGETLGLVGESGCGKTTAGRSLLRLIEPTDGDVIFEGTDITELSKGELRPYRRDMQIIFQDPFSSLNPRMTVLDIVGESLEVHGRVSTPQEKEEKVVQLLERVGIPAAWINRYPHEFSGGQRQRIGIARAIALDPKFIVCDEAVSALDVSIQAQVINLLIRLREEMNLSYLFIAHDLSVVKHISNRIAVMYLGQIVEKADSDQLFERPTHPYTRALLSAIPEPNPRKKKERIVLEGDVPTPLNPPSGCRFHTRCPAVMDRCSEEVPEAIDLGDGHFSKCFLLHDLEIEGDWYETYKERLHREIARNQEETARKEKERKKELEKALAEAAEKAAAAKASGEVFESEEEEEAPEEIEETTEFGEKAGKGLCVLGGVSILFFSIPLGVIFVLIGWWLLVKLTEQKAALTVGLGASLVLCIGAGMMRVPLLNKRKARLQFEGLKEHIEAHRSLVGQLPSDLGELRWRLYEIFRNGEPVDPWGKPWTYEILESGEFQVGSYGPDKTYGTRDDIGTPRPPESDEQES